MNLPYSDVYQTVTELTYICPYESYNYSNHMSYKLLSSQEILALAEVSERQHTQIMYNLHFSAEIPGKRETRNEFVFHKSCQASASAADHFLVRFARPDFHKHDFM